MYRRVETKSFVTLDAEEDGNLMGDGYDAQFINATRSPIQLGSKR